jgi:hypothetical protein
MATRHSQIPASSRRLLLTITRRGPIVEKEHTKIIMMMESSRSMRLFLVRAVSIRLCCCRRRPKIMCRRWLYHLEPHMVTLFTDVVPGCLLSIIVFMREGETTCREWRARATSTHNTYIRASYYSLLRLRWENLFTFRKDPSSPNLSVVSCRHFYSSSCQHYRFEVSWHSNRWDLYYRWSYSCFVV